MRSIARFLGRIGWAGGRAPESARAPRANILEIEFGIPNMVCEGCAEKIGGVLHALPGVREVRPDVWRKRIRVLVESSQINAQQLKEALAAAGYTAVEGSQ